MKKYTQLFITLCLFMLVYSISLQSQVRTLKWSNPDNPSNFYQGNFSVCGVSTTKTFKIYYDHCPGYIYPNVVPNCLADCQNSIRYTVKLYKDGININTKVFKSSKEWSNTFFYNLDVPPGNYKAHIKVERRKIFCFFGWEDVSHGWTNGITVYDTPATPSFNINGIAIPANGAPINVCASNITINAANTSCESMYEIVVEESDRWWNRTYNYEWNRWFSGAAPNGINLQQLSTNYSYPPYFTGSGNRQGSPLIGGQLSNGVGRYYRIGLCTGEPTWNCKFTLIKVNGNCRTEIPDDTNQYFPIEDQVLNIDETLDAEVLDNDNSRTIRNLLEQEVDMDKRKNEPIEKSDIMVDCYPNPMRDNTTFRYTIHEERKVSLAIFDMLGEKIAQPIQNTVQASGEYEVSFDASSLPAGTYFYVFIAGDKRISKKIIVM